MRELVCCLDSPQKGGAPAALMRADGRAATFGTPALEAAVFTYSGTAAVLTKPLDPVMRTSAGVRVCRRASECVCVCISGVECSSFLGPITFFAGVKCVRLSLV
jgi:hypothetical protein